MAQSDYDRDRRRRTDKRVEDVAIDRKTTNDALKEELLEKVVDQAGKWIERGGFGRLWLMVKIILWSIFAIIGLGALYLFG